MDRTRGEPPPGAMCDDSLLARVINENVLTGWGRRSCACWWPPSAERWRLRRRCSATTSGFPAQDGKDRPGRAFFGFSRTKEGEHPTAVLEALGVEGIRLLVEDGSEYNDDVAELGLTRGGCWSHQPTYFFNAAVQHEDAKPGLRTVHDLFEIERQVADLSDADRLAVRKARRAPLVHGFNKWVKALVPKVLPGSRLGYAIGQEPRMRLFLTHGDVPLHNNLSELLLRHPIVGRKNCC